MRKLFYMMLTCFAVFFCEASLFAQGWPDTCAHLKQWEYGQPGNEQEYQEQYDTLRLYIKKCANSDDQSFRAFGRLGAAVQYMNDDPTRFDSLRAWLISVLYLNTTNPQYFCACLGEIGGTYQIGKFSPLGYLALWSYTRKYHPECIAGNDSADYARDSMYDYQHGYDPTHLPSLDSMGLGFLLHQNDVPPQSTASTNQYLTSFTSNPNPFLKETTIEFILTRMSYVTLILYDDLGRPVWGDGKGSSLEAGTHVIHLDGSSLPSGTLYARIATGFGEVKTIKLINQ
jgi:hypothetical protein